MTAVAFEVAEAAAAGPLFAAAAVRMTVGHLVAVAPSEELAAPS